ncbi:D-2-hydroxyglutarate dehydrogenase, mitochondrial [Dionaea muscipula]
MEKDDSHHTAHEELGFQPNHTTQRKVEQQIHMTNSGVPETLMRARAVYKYDLSLSVEKMYDLVEEMRAWLDSKCQFSLTSSSHSAKVLGYGHMGIENLHLNISASQYDNARRFKTLCGEGELRRRLPGKGQRVHCARLIGFDLISPKLEWIGAEEAFPLAELGWTSVNSGEFGTLGIYDAIGWAQNEFNPDDKQSTIDMHILSI